jgi:uncharacterized membrane protein YdjX (TVP38/TMEM64 family)
MKNSKLWLVLLILPLIAAFFYFDLGQYLSLDYLKQQHQTITQFYAANTVLTIAVFFALYVLITALSLPGAAIMTLAAGAIFGFWVGLVLVSFASTAGATLAFLFSRFLFRETVQNRFGTHLGAINRGVEEEGAFYLFTLRLIPAVPFFAVNLLMGLTPIKTGVYALVSQIGMLPGTAVFVNAGNQLSKIDSLGDILSPSLIAAFALLGIFPIAAKKLIGLYKSRTAVS